MSYRGVYISGREALRFRIIIDVSGLAREVVEINTNLLRCQRAESGDGEGAENDDSLKCSTDIHVEEHRVSWCQEWVLHIEDDSQSEVVHFYETFGKRTRLTYLY